MNAVPRPLPFDAAALPGLSEKLLRSHHHNNYGGAVRRLNAIRAELKTVPPGAAAFLLNGLKREELIATNSMLLHELYFDSLDAAPTELPPPMVLALSAAFGSSARWGDEFSAMGKALAGGSGWVVLTFQPREGTLINQWAADHTHALAGGVPLLALDMYEHAYHLDFGADAAAYVNAFMPLIAWDRVYDRYQRAVHAASVGLGTDLRDPRDTLVLDVRRAGVYKQALSTLPGARWCDPASVQDWGPGLPNDRDIVVYCVYGHEVSRATAIQLRSQGLRARFLEGGIDGWQAAGRPLADKGASS